MNVHPDVNFEELARSTDDFNGAQLKAVCVEAGMLALRRDATEVCILQDFFNLSHIWQIFLIWALHGNKYWSQCWFCQFQVNHEDFNEGIIQVQAKKKSSLNYYA